MVLLRSKTPDGPTAAAAAAADDVGAVRSHLGWLRGCDGDLDNAVRQVIALSNEPLQVADEHRVEIVSHRFIEPRRVI